MATFEVKVNGGIYEVDAPDEKTAWRWADHSHQTIQPEEKYSATDGMSNTELAFAGLGKAAVGWGRGVGQLLGMVDDKEIEESRKLDADLMNTTAGFAGNIVGNVGMALLPGGALKGASTVAKLAPGMLKYANGISRAGGALLAPKNLSQALAVGAGTGLIQPSTSNSETAGNMTLGAVGGAIAPAVGGIYKSAKSLVEPFYESGRNQILARALRSAAGNQADDVVSNLKASRPLVPGSNPTAAEAARNPGIASLQRAAIATDPVTTNELTLRQANNSQARSNALDDLIPDRAHSVAARELATKELYDEAKNVQIQITPELKTLMERPSMQSALKRAGELAKENGEQIDLNSLTGTGAQYIKMALDDISNAGPASGIGGNEIRAIKATKAAYLKELEQQIPSYLKANQEYAKLSRPITQFDVAQEIAGKGKDFRGNFTPAAYARALSDKSAQRVTGRGTAKLDGVFDPEQLSTLNAIKEDLLNQDYANTAGRSVGSNTVQNLAFNNILDQAGIPTMIRSFAPAGLVGNIASRVGDVGYKRSNDQLASKLAEALLNPSQTAEIMEKGIPTAKALRMAEILKRGGASIGVASPYLLNSGKE